METIKFIVEIDEQYIREHANPEKMKELVENGSKEDLMMGLADMFSFGSVEKAIDKGTTKFTINRENINPNANGIFENAVSKLAALAGVARNKEKEKEGE